MSLSHEKKKKMGTPKKDFNILFFVQLLEFLYSNTRLILLVIADYVKIEFPVYFIFKIY